MPSKVIPFNTLKSLKMAFAFSNQIPIFIRYLSLPRIPVFLPSQIFWRPRRLVHIPSVCFGSPCDRLFLAKSCRKECINECPSPHTLKGHYTSLLPNWASHPTEMREKRSSMKQDAYHNNSQEEEMNTLEYRLQIYEYQFYYNKFTE